MSLIHAFPLWVFIALPLIPIVLHLLTLQRLRTVELPTYRFLFDSYVQQRRRTQFLEALLAMLRVLFILFVVILISRPVVKNFSGLFQSGSGREVILLVDCSASMNAKAKGQTAFERAKTVAKQVVERLGKDDRVTLVRVTAHPEEVFSRFTTDAANLQDRIDNLQLSPARANLFAALNAVFGDERHQPANPVVYFVTDAQANSFKEIERQKQIADRFVPAGTPFVLVDVGSTEARINVAVVGDPPPRQRAVAGLPVSLRARVMNSSAEDTEAVLTFLINDKKVEEQVVKLKANETVTRKFAPYTPSEAGVLKGRFEVSLGSKGGDAFPEDDRYEFSLQVQPKLKVLIVNGNPSPDTAENEAFYLKAALSIGGQDPPSGKSTSPVAGAAEFARALDVTEESEISWGGLDEPRLKAKLDQYAVVILANCGLLHNYNGYAFAKLRDYVAEGGGLLIFPGDKVQPDLYNATALPSTPREYLVGVRLGNIEGDPENAVTFRNLARINFDHRVFAIFDQPSGPENRYFERVLVKRHFALTLADARNTAVLAEYPDHSPAIVESQFGDGVVILTSFPMNVKWTNLPLRVEFVPLLLQMVAQTQRRADAEGPAVVAAGGTAEISATSSWAPVAGKVTPEKGPSLELQFERSAGRMAAVYDQTTERGYYTAAVQSKGDPSKSATLAFAVNLAPEESDTARVNEERVKELLPSAKVSYVDQSAEAQQVEALDRTTEFWREVIWLVFFVIAVEFLLATVRGGRAPGEEAPTIGERLAGYSPTSWVGRMTGGK